MSFRNATSFAGIAIVLIYVIGSGLWVNTGDSWYNNHQVSYLELSGPITLLFLVLQPLL
jgi:hypothetical protein